MPPACLWRHAGGMSIPPAAPDQLTTLRDELRALEDEFAGAMTRMYQVGNHLTRVRAGLDRATPGAAPQVQLPVGPAAAPPTAAAPTPVTHAPPVPPPFVPAPPPFVPSPAARESWWQREGVIAKVLAAVGAGITLIGVAFLLAIAIQAGYFGPLARVLSGAALAVALVAAALVVKRRQESTVGALGLAATGFAAAYLDVIAVTRIYDWVPAAAGLALAGLVALGGLVIARAWGSQLLAVLIVLGVAGLAPVVGDVHVLLVGGFLLVLTIASYAAQIGRRWPVLEVARIVPTSLYALVAVAMQDQQHDGTVMAVVLALFVLLTTWLPLHPEVTSRLALPPALAGLAAVATAPALLAGGMEDRWVGLLVLALLAASHLTAAWLGPVTGVDPLHRLREISLIIAAVALAIAVFRGLDSSYEPLGLLLLALAWVGVAATSRDQSTAAVSMPLAVIALLAGSRHLPALVSRSLADEVEPVHVLEGVVLVALLLALGVMWRLALPAGESVSRAWWAAAGLALPFPLVLGGAVLGEAAGIGDDPAGSGFLVGHALSTVAWMALAATLLVRGLGRSADAGTAVRAGLGLAAIAVGKLLFFDLSALSGLSRVLSFIVAGILLLGMGVGYAQALERARRHRLPVDNPEPSVPGPPTV